MCIGLRFRVTPQAEIHHHKALKPDITCEECLKGIPRDCLGCENGNRKYEVPFSLWPP